MKLSFLTALLLLLTCSLSLNWQSSGNLSLSNQSLIQGYINQNFSPTHLWSQLINSGNTVLSDFSVGFSNYLNEQWDPAWNVVTIYLSVKGNSDCVFYGYAFRDHWMWFNGYAMNDGYYVTFILWKDYNCVTWVTYNPNSGGPQFSYSLDTVNLIMGAFLSMKSTFTYDDIWSIGHTFLEQLPNYNAAFAGSDKAYSIIITQSYYSSFYARICVKDYYSRITQIGTQIDGTAWGQSFFMQMR
jgi:hypothetical protein